MDNRTTLLGNRQWVERYVKGFTALGALMVIASVIYGALSVTQLSRLSEFHWMIAQSSVLTASACLRGILVMSLASFLSYVLGVRQQPGWILRSADKVLYILGGLALLSGLFQSLHILQVVRHSASHPVGLGFSIAFHGLSSATIALIWLVFGLILRRVLPVVEESRTLV